MNFDGLKDAVMRLLSDDILTLLIHPGYLTYDFT